MFSPQGSVFDLHIFGMRPGRPLAGRVLRKGRGEEWCFVAGAHSSTEQPDEKASHRSARLRGIPFTSLATRGDQSHETHAPIDRRDWL